jgi:hypothetical protein
MIQRDQALSAHFVVAMLAAFIALSGALLTRAAIVATDLADARAQIPMLVEVLQPADWASVLRAARVLAQADGVVESSPMTPERAAILLERNGVALDAKTLPAFYQVEITVEGRIKEPIATLKSALAKDGITVEITAAQPAAPLPIREAAWGAGLLLMTLAFTLVWLAARAQAQVASATAVVNADIGAPLSRTLQSYGRAGAMFGFRAAMIGGLAGVSAVLAALASPRGAPTLGEIWTMTGRLELLILFAVPLGIALAAASGARAGGADAHRKAERIG